MIGELVASPGGRLADPILVNKNVGLNIYDDPLFVKMGQGLKNKLELQSIPKVPKGLKSAEDFFKAVEDAAHHRWIEASEVDLVPLHPEPATARRIIKSGDYVDFFDLSRTDRQLWLAHLGAFSQEQQEAHRIGYDWASKISARALDRIGMQRGELEHIFRIKSLLQAPVDNAFISQLNFEALLEANPNIQLAPVSNDGDEYVYEVTWPQGKIERLPFADVFYEDFGDIANQLVQIANLTDKLIEEKELPESYRMLAKNARILLPMYSSSLTNSVKIKEYLDQLKLFYLEITDSDCPVILSGMIYSLAGRRAEVALDVLVRTPFTRSLDRQYGLPFREAFKNEWADFSGLKTPAKPPDFVHSSKSASMLYWGALGIGAAESSFVNVNIVEQKAVDLYERTKLLFNKTISYKRFNLSYLVTTHMHEGGHAIGNQTAKDTELLISQFGNDGLGDIVDELIGDHVGLIPYYESIQAKAFPISPYEYVYGLLAGYYRDVTDSVESVFEYAMYGLIGKIIIGELCQAGSIKMEKGKIDIVDPEVGMDRIKSLTVELKKLCQSNDLDPTTPTKVLAFLDKLKRDLFSHEEYAKVLELFTSSKN